MVKNVTRTAGLIAGLTVSAFALASTAGAAGVYYGDDDKKVKEEKVEKKSRHKKTIKVIQTGKPVIVDTDNDVHVVIERQSPDIKVRRWVSNPHQQKETLEKLDRSIEQVEKRLKKTKNKAERDALEQALAGLQVAKESLVEQHIQNVFPTRHRIEIERAHTEALHEALNDLHEQEGDLSEMRIEVIEDINEAREELAEALEELDIELDIQTDGEIRSIRLRALKDAERELEEIEKHQLKAIKQAEKELRKTRERLERELAEKEKQKQKKKEKEK